VARRNYDGLEYAPPGEQVTPGYRNTWNGFSVQPKQGDWSLMQAHISEILCNSDPILYEYVLDWLAQSVQYAGRPGRTALVLQGTKRTGKGVFAHAVRNLFGPHGFVANDGRQLVGNFNAQLENVSLLFADELRLMQPDVAPKFRSMLTEPTISIERKGVDLYLQKNTLHVIIASNDEQVVWTSGDERRYVILKVSSARANDAAYFGPLLAEQQPGGSGQAAMLYDLLQSHSPEDTVVAKVVYGARVRGLRLNSRRRIPTQTVVTGCKRVLVVDDPVDLAGEQSLVKRIF